MSQQTDNWIYHERQQAALCGQHALNNLVQSQAFSVDQLADIAQDLDARELAFMRETDPNDKKSSGGRSKEYLARLAEGSGNVDEAGNFSIQVLRAALAQSPYNLTLPNLAQEGLRSIDPTTLEGFICNRQNHWFAIRLINGAYWNLNSTADRPVRISHFRLAAEIQALQAGGYSVFTSQENRLPASCSNGKDRSRGLPQYWWKEDDLVAGKGDSAITGATDPWANVGSGMRLDGGGGGGGGREAASSYDSYGGDDDSDLQAAILASQGLTGEGGGGSNRRLTEDEMMQMAIDASMSQQSSQPSSQQSSQEASSEASSQDDDQKLEAEPSETEPGVVKLQLRLPNTKRAIRCFRSTDKVSQIYKFVCQESPSPGGRGVLELRAFFPPKSIAEFKGRTIGDCGLAGESLAGSYK
jgi:ataxin-3